MWELILKKFKKEDIDEPPYDYDFLINLDEREYPKYLKKMFYNMTGKKLNLKHPKTFNEKIQWLKLYDTTPLKTKLTDKVLVRDWVKEKIGENYLKPVLWIGEKFDDIPFEKLPEKFIIKANHGCKWHYIIKNKTAFINNKKLYNYIKMRFDGWMQQTFFPWGGFELQYKNITPKIIIEPLLLSENNKSPSEYEIYCFNGVPKIFQKITYTKPAKCSVYNQNFLNCEIKFNVDYVCEFENPDSLLYEAVKLSQIVSEKFKLVRVDWLIFNNKIYFNEMTFTPFAGFFQFEKEEWNNQLGNMLKI